jgi:hypothetical protein
MLRLEGRFPHPVLTDEQRTEVAAICDQVSERLETDDEYTYNLDERRGKAGSFADAVWDQAMVMLRSVGFNAERTGALIAVRKR